MVLNAITIRPYGDSQERRMNYGVVVLPSFVLGYVLLA